MLKKCVNLKGILSYHGHKCQLGVSRNNKKFNIETKHLMEKKLQHSKLIGVTT